MLNRRITLYQRLPFQLLALIALLLVITNTAYAERTILNVSYDPTRELYKEYNELFKKHWQEQKKEELTSSSRMVVAANKPALFWMAWKPMS